MPWVLKYVLNLCKKSLRFILRQGEEPCVQKLTKNPVKSRAEFSKVKNVNIESQENDKRTNQETV